MKILFDNNEKTIAEFSKAEEYGNIPSPLYIARINNGQSTPLPVMLKKYDYRCTFTAPRFGHTGRPVYLLYDGVEFIDKYGFIYRRKIGGPYKEVSWKEFFLTVSHTLRLEMGHKVTLFDELRWSRDAIRHAAHYRATTGTDRPFL